MDKLIEKEKIILLEDGMGVVIRQISCDDVTRLDDFFSRISRESMYSRYLSYKQGFLLAEEKQFCTVEEGVRMAIVAEVEEDGEPIIIGLAEYDGVTSDMAEIGIVVEDRFQGLGIGTQMLKEIVKLAIEDGINVFSASVHPSNSQIMNFVRKSQLPVIKRLTYGAWEIQVKLNKEVD